MASVVKEPSSHHYGSVLANWLLIHYFIIAFRKTTQVYSNNFKQCYLSIMMFLV